MLTARLKSITTVAALAMALAGCAVSNEGLVDMRRTAAEPGQAQGPLALRQKNFSLGASHRIEPNESLYVTLRTAYIADFIEIGLDDSEWLQPNGEIAVVANAFEVLTGQELDFSDMQDGRLVFYSDDVREGQLLNFNNLPVYGPKTYSGQPFALRLTVFELDGGSAQTKALLSGLAKAGGAIHAPASPVLGLLNGLGASMLDADRNDTQFRYTLQFSSAPGQAGINSFVLESGNYVFVRLSDRTAEVPWDDLVLDENKGELYRKSSGEKYRENTYLVVEVNAGGSALDVDLKQNTFSELLTALERSDRAAAEELGVLSAAVNDALANRQRARQFNAAKAELSVLTDAMRPAVRKREAAEAIVAIVARSVAAPGGGESSDDASEGARLSEAQIAFVISRLRAHVANSAARDSRKISSAEYELLTPGSLAQPGNRLSVLNLLAAL